MTPAKAFDQSAVYSATVDPGARGAFRTADAGLQFAMAHQCAQSAPEPCVCSKSRGIQRGVDVAAQRLRADPASASACCWCVTTAYATWLVVCWFKFRRAYAHRFVASSANQRCAFPFLKTRGELWLAWPYTLFYPLATPLPTGKTVIAPIRVARHSSCPGYFATSPFAEPPVPIPPIVWAY